MRHLLRHQQLWRPVLAASTPKETCLRCMVSSTAQVNGNPRNRFSSPSFEAIDKKRPFSSSSLPSPEHIFSENYRDINISDGPIRVYEHGPQTRNDTQQPPPVLLLHGSMLDTAALTWRHIMPNLSSHRRVFAIDLPRHGASRPWPSTTLDQPKLESVLTEILDTLSLPRVSLVGLSMGGGLATGYALTHPSRISALVAINPGGMEAARPYQFLTWLATRCGPFLRWSTRHMASSPDYLRETMANNYVAGKQTRDFDEFMELITAEAQAGARHGEKGLDDWQIAMYGPWKMNVDFTRRFEGLEVPSLWIHGNKDQLVREEVMRRAAELARNSRFVSIPDAGHAATGDQPERVHESIVEFLNEVGA